MFTLIPGLTVSYIELAIYVVGFMGALALMYAVLLEYERMQDEVLVVGSASMFVYALYKLDYIFMLAMLGVFCIAGRELIQILRGRHHHVGGRAVPYEPPQPGSKS